MRRRTSKRTTAVLAVVALAGAAALVAGVVRQRPVGAAAGPAPASGAPLKVAHSGKCLNVAKASTADKAPIVQYTCVGAANERWRAVPLDDGSYQLVAEHSGKCLNVAGGGTANRAPLVQYRCVGAANERWSPLQRPDSTTFMLVAQHSGKCLNVAGASSANGAAVVQYDCIATAANEIWSGTPSRNADPYSSGPTVGLQPTPDAALHLAYVDGDGTAFYGATFPESGQVQWSALPTEQRLDGKPALLPAGSGVQVLARSTLSDVFGMLPPGRAHWTDTGGNVASGPVAGTGVAVATGWDGRLWSAPDDGVHVPFLAWRPVAGSVDGLTGPPATGQARTGTQVFAADTGGTVRTATLIGSSVSAWTTVGTGAADLLGVATLPGYRYAVVTAAAGQVKVKIQEDGGVWPAAWQLLDGVSPSGPPAILYAPDGRLSVLVRGGDSAIHVATETAQATGTFGAWQAVGSSILTDPVPFTYQPLTGGQTWGFAVRTEDGQTLLFTANGGAGGAAPGFDRRSLPAPRR